MSTPRRRSSRLRGRSTAATPGKSSNYVANRLGSLAEGDEDPTSLAMANSDAVASTPQTPRTPRTAGPLQPSREEMHPSKVHQSTVRKPDSGLRLGFVDMQATGNNQPSGITQRTPSKIGISDSSFEFTFARPGPQLGPDAQRMMDELRGEALKIKARLAAEREEEKKLQRESSIVEGRKIAHPKGKVGRFSDVHMAEFKKMDSIASHASAFRGQPSRLAPTSQSLKRTQSKAQLQTREQTQNEVEFEKDDPYVSDRLENTVPAKRARNNIADDASSARPTSQGNPNNTLPATPTRTHQSTVASLTTPTQASLARAASVKKTASQIPMLARSSSKPTLIETPKKVTESSTLSDVPRSQPKSFLRSPNKLDRIRSMLRYPSSAKIPTSIPSLYRSPSKLSFEKVPSMPVTPVRKEQQVGNVFTPAAARIVAPPKSPSPTKSGIPKSMSRVNLDSSSSGMEGLSARNVISYPALPAAAGTSHLRGDIQYPSLDGVRPLPEPPRQFGKHSNAAPSVPSTFSFRADSTINLGRSPKGFGSSPGQSSVRQVRPSFTPHKLPGSYPGGKENTTPAPSIKHGMSNKKRRRVDSDDDEDEEGAIEPSPKKQKAAELPFAGAHELLCPSAKGSKTLSPIKKKPVLSMSRLNMLARPKLRR